MGQWSYVCRGCGQSLRGGEHVLLRHVRSGEKLGEVVGVYDSYGSVDGERERPGGFMADDDGKNSDDAILTSCGVCRDGVDHAGRRRLYNHPVDGKVAVNFLEHREILWELHKIRYGLPQRERCTSDFQHAADDLFSLLPDAEPVRSGVVAWHCACLHGGDPGLTPSESADDQGCGDPRPEYIKRDDE